MKKTLAAYFNGKTFVPFCTSGSSGIGISGQTLAELVVSGNMLEGQRFSPGASEEEVRNWIENLG